MLSVDPVTADPNTGAKFNRYAYGLNNPYRFTDPDGRDDVDYFHRTDSLYSAASRFDLPGFTTVMGHSWPDTFQDNRQMPHKGGPAVGYESLKRDIQAAGRKGDYIFLGGCALGQGGTPAKLAKDFNTHVIAGDGFVRKNENAQGDITYTVNSKADGSGAAGAFRMWTPSGIANGKIASVTMRADGKAVIKAAEAPTGTRIKPTVVIDPERGR